MVQRVSPNEAQQLIADRGYVYIDVRSTQEFDEGHPSGAFNVPLMHFTGGGMEPNPDFVAVIERHFERDAKLVLGCKAGGRSLRAAQMLEAAGFTNVFDQRAGWDGARDPFGKVTEPGWSASGLPSATRAEAGRSYGELASG